MDQKTEQILQKLLDGTASSEEIGLFKQQLASGQISIGGNVSQSVIILGNGNTVQLTPQALETLGFKKEPGNSGKRLHPALPRNPIVEGINLLPYDYDQRIQNFLTEYLGTDQHPVPFGGRDDALHMLDNWLAETTPYLLLAAPAGRGKSALLVRWLDSLKARDDLALAFVIGDRSEATCAC